MKVMDPSTILKLSRPATVAILLLSKPVALLKVLRPATDLILHLRIPGQVGQMIGVDSDLIILVGLHLGHESCIDFQLIRLDG